MADDVWNFSQVEQRTQWPYHKWFSAHIGKRIGYSFVRRGWDREIGTLAAAPRLHYEIADPGAVRLDDEDRRTFEKIGAAGVARLMEFLDQVTNVQKAEVFCRKAAIAPTSLKALLDKVRRYLPAGAPMRQLVAAEDTVTQGYVDRLTAHKMGHSLALLEAGLTREGRARIVAETGIPQDALLDLVRRADMSRLRLMAGGMIRQSWALGYCGLGSFRSATPDEYYARCQEYYSRTGKGMPFDFTAKNVASHIERMKQAARILDE